MLIMNQILSLLGLNRDNDRKQIKGNRGQSASLKN